jgi:hypothetical protein
MVTPLATTATPLPTSGWLLLAGTAVLAGLAYAASCWLWPFRHCRRCDGGRIHRDDRKVFRLCRRCKGTGRRLRLGRRLYNHTIRLRREAD